MKDERFKKYYKIIYAVIIVIMISLIITTIISAYYQKEDMKNIIKDNKYNDMVSDYGIEYSTFSENASYERILKDCGKYQIIDNYKDYCNYLSSIKNYDNYFHGKIQMAGSINKLNTKIGTKTFFNSSNVLLFKVSKDKIYNLKDMKISDIRYDNNQISINLLGTYTDYSKLNAETGYIFMIPVDKQIKTAKIDMKWTSTKEIK